MSSDGYEVRPVEATGAELAATRALFGAAFPTATHLDERTLDWQYNENPDGKAVGFNAWAGGELAAHYVTLRLKLLLQGREVPGLLSLNTATHPKHQGRGLFTRLAEATYRRAAEAGFAGVVGVANAASTPGFVRKLGFQLVAPLEARLGMGPVARHVAEPAYEFRRVWSRDALAWRLRHPHGNYRFVADSRGVRVEAPTGRYGIWAVMAVCEPGLGRELSAGRGPLNPMKVWLGLDGGVDWERSRYFTMPRALRPSPLNLIFRRLASEGPRLRAEAVRFEAIDFDAY